jgi:hypothetical protein
MDTEGARLLAHVIGQQENWRRAAAVRDGRQPPRDPDLWQLTDFDARRRRYRSSGGATYEKRLGPDGFWA